MNKVLEFRKESIKRILDKDLRVTTDESTTKLLIENRLLEIEDYYQNRYSIKAYIDLSEYRVNRVEVTYKNRSAQFDDVFMNIALNIATLSRAERRKVGCIIVKEGNIIGIGFNGTPSGFDNCCEYIEEDTTLVTKPEVLHAESNALMKACTSTQSTVDSTLYVTCEPCLQCSKLIIQAKVTKVVYLENYRTHEGLELLRRAGIEVIHLD